jgi:hypothetical protein
MLAILDKGDGYTIGEISRFHVFLLFRMLDCGVQSMCHWAQKGQTLPGLQGLL